MRKSVLAAVVGVSVLVALGANGDSTTASLGLPRLVVIAENVDVAPNSEHLGPWVNTLNCRALTVLSNHSPQVNPQSSTLFVDLQLGAPSGGGILRTGTLPTSDHRDDFGAFYVGNVVGPAIAAPATRPRLYTTPDTAVHITKAWLFCQP